MSKILLIGYNPPQLEGHSKIEAAHYRTWQFLEPLLNDGHTICLCTQNLSTNGVQKPSIPAEWGQQLVHHSIPLRHQIGWIHQLQQIHDTFEPDCIVAVNFDCCLSATKLRTNKPIWMDIYGDYLTIIQAARYRAGSDRGISTSIAFVQQVLQKGDIFSVCSTPQKHAIVGELALAGRLNSHTFGYEFARIVLPGSPSIDTTIIKKVQTPLSAIQLPNNSFTVLWCGGYNTWTDVDTLFAGLEWAMTQSPKIHFVSVGANTYGGPDNVYDRFLRLIEKSQYQNRFHMLGWRPWAEIPSYYRKCDVGLNIDALHYETIYGTRTRLVEMIASGLPVITSLGCELSDLLNTHGVGLTFEIGDWRGLGERILTLASNDDLCNNMSRSAFNYARNGLSFTTTTLPVRIWVREPRSAPDKIPLNFQKKLQYLGYQARSIMRQIIWQIVGLER